MTTSKLSIVLLLLLMACQDFVPVSPPDFQITDKTVFNNDESARAAMGGLLVEMAQTANFNNSTIQVLTGLSSDELITNESKYVEFQSNSLRADNPYLHNPLWISGYRYIYLANTILEGLEHSSLVREEVKRQLLGEAYFIRAFCLWNLVNMYGEVPVILTTDLERNASASRSDVDNVYTAIVSDLFSSRQLLFKDVNFDRGAYLRPTYWSATALLARVYLYMHKWEDSEEMANEVIEDGKQFRLEDVSAVFAARNAEAIWQVQQVVPGMGTWYAHAFVPDAQGAPLFEISPGLMSTFDAIDRRRIMWIDSLSADDGHTYYYVNKYHALYSAEQQYSEIRLADLFLIRAEARLERDILDEATLDINIIRARAGLDVIDHSKQSKEALLDSLRVERKRELFVEGHRWYDLKRWGAATTTLSNLSYKDWQETDILYPIPQSEIDVNKWLLPQNNGYR